MHALVTLDALEAVRLGPSSNIQQLMMAPQSSSSISSFPPGSNGTLLVMGHLQINSFGNASAAFYDGSTWHPYFLTTRLDGQPGRIQLMAYASQDGTAADSSSKRFLHCRCSGSPLTFMPQLDVLSVAAVVLVSIALSTGILLASTGLAFLAVFIRRNKRGYEASDAVPVWLPGQGFTDNALAAISADAVAAGAAGAFVVRTSAEKDQMRAATTTQPPPVPPLPPLPPPAVNVSPAAEATTITLPFGTLLAIAKNYTGGPVSESNPRLGYAIHPFNAQASHELDLQQGETFVVIDTGTDPEWWLGAKKTVSVAQPTMTNRNGIDQTFYRLRQYPLWCLSEQPCRANASHGKWIPPRDGGQKPIILPVILLKVLTHHFHPLYLSSTSPSPS